MKHILLAAVAGAAFAFATASQAQAPTVSPAARAAHGAAIVLDTHFDTPALFSRPGWDIADRHSVAMDGSQVDLPRMIDGGVDGGVFTIFTGQGPRTPPGDNAARAAGLVRAMDIHRMLAKHPDKFELALTADDAAKINARGKRFVYISIENAYPLAGDVGMLQAYYALGVRMVSFAHTSNNDWSDSANTAPEWNGLSPKGRELIAEANRLGVILDPSHASDATLDQILDLSKAPVVLSHTGAKAVFNHPRNIPDTLIRKLAAKGGVIQINAFSGYMIPAAANPERDRALAALNTAHTAKYGPRSRWTQADVVAMTAERRALLARFPTPRATLDDFMNHMLHVIKLVGVDHVGVSGDFDGGGGIEGLDSVADFPAITDRLIKAGYTAEDVRKIWGGNVLRVMREVEAYAASQKAAPAA